MRSVNYSAAKPQLPCCKPEVACSTALQLRIKLRKGHEQPNAELTEIGDVDAAVVIEVECAVYVAEHPVKRRPGIAADESVSIAVQGVAGANCDAIGADGQHGPVPK